MIATFVLALLVLKFEVSVADVEQEIGASEVCQAGSVDACPTLSLLQISHDVDSVVPVETSSNATTSALRLLNMVYDGHGEDAYADRSIDRAKAEREVAHTKGGNAQAAVYGELLPHGVIDMLNHVGARRGQKYYDLGSGFGKTAVLAYLLGLDATGVELAADRWEKACEALTILKKTENGGQIAGQTGLKFVKASFTDVDFSDADVVFTDSVMFSPELLENLAKSARNLKPGALIVSAHGLPGPGFEHVDEFHAATSWDSASSWTLQKRSSEPSKSLAEIGHVRYDAKHVEVNENICRI